jgi:hypothetical protein
VKDVGSYLTSAVVAAAPVVAGAEPDIRDIRGPIHIPALWPVLLLIAGAVLVALALGATTLWLVRRWRRSHIKTAAEIALERLERARSLAKDGHASELSAELSNAVREYIQARFELRAPHRTTEEFLYDLLAAPGSPVAKHRESLGEFLDACDLAKFARFAIDVEHMQEMVYAAQSFVRETDAARPAESRRSNHKGAHGAQEAST